MMTNDLVFIENTHQYLYKGILIPCVSEILGFVFPDNFKDIPEYVIRNKGKYGTKVHNLIELVINNQLSLEELEEMNIDPKIKSSVRQFIKEERNWEAGSIEQQVHYLDKYAGTYDILTKDGYIIDLKTTAAKDSSCLLDSQNDVRLSKAGELAYDKKFNLQISLYYLALENCKGIEYKEYGYLKWLPKGGITNGYQKAATWPKEKLFEVLDKYEKSKKQSN